MKELNKEELTEETEMTDREKTMYHIGACGSILRGNGDITNRPEPVLKRAGEHCDLVGEDWAEVLKTGTHEEWQAFHRGQDLGNFEREALTK